MSEPYWGAIFLSGKLAGISEGRFFMLTIFLSFLVF